jgi:hypothetical protein
MVNSTTNAAAKQLRGRPFKKGQSGNPNGKKPGTRHHVTLALQALLEGEAEAISRKAVELALAGDMAAIRLLIERILPTKKELPIQVYLPTIRTAADTVEAVAAVVNAVAAGEITPSQGQAMASMISELTHAIEVQDIAMRLATLEKRVS